MENLNFNEKYSLRTKKFAIAIIHFYSQHCKQTEELRVIGKQLLRSGTSVAANFRAYIRGRSVAERFSKLSIVVEETDESYFWLELLEDAGLLGSQYTSALKQEAEELTKIFSKTRANMKK